MPHGGLGGGGGTRGEGRDGEDSFFLASDGEADVVPVMESLRWRLGLRLQLLERNGRECSLRALATFSFYISPADARRSVGLARPVATIVAIGAVAIRRVS